jgi:hypothetical protein
MTTLDDHADDIGDQYQPGQLTLQQSLQAEPNGTDDQDPLTAAQ